MNDDDTQVSPAVNPGVFSDYNQPQTSPQGLYGQSPYGQQMFGQQEPPPKDDASTTSTIDVSSVPEFQRAPLIAAFYSRKFAFVVFVFLIQVPLLIFGYIDQHVYLIVVETLIAAYLTGHVVQRSITGERL